MSEVMHGSQTWVEELRGEPYQVCEELAGIEQLEPVARLYSWSLNYEPGANPWCVMLDLIGWSEDELGESIVKNPREALGYTELSMLADVLQAYATNPGYVREAIGALLLAESSDESTPATAGTK